MSWIFGRFHRDALVFVLPGVIAVALSKLLSPQNFGAVLFVAFVTLFIDSGHVYTSGWRVFRFTKDNPRARLYVALIPAVIVTCFVWLYSGWPGFWSFVVYFTVFHHIRQFYGFGRWYQFLNRRRDVWSNRFIYALTLLPLVAFHFRSDWKFQIYREGDILNWPSQITFQIFFAAWFVAFVAWLGYEIRLWTKGRREPNRILAIAVPAVLHAICFLLGRTMIEVILPLLAVHGIAYLAVMVLGMQAVDSTKWRKSTFFVSMVVISSAMLAGLWEWWLDDYGLVENSRSILWLQAFVSAILIAPNLWHYIVDGMMWRPDDPAAAVLYQRGDVEK